MGCMVTGDPSPSNDADLRSHPSSRQRITSVGQIVLGSSLAIGS